MKIKPPAQRRDSAWLTSNELADVLDIRGSLVRRDIAPRVPADLRRKGSDGTWRFYAPAVLRMRMEPAIRAELRAELRTERRLAELGDELLLVESILAGEREGVSSDDAHEHADDDAHD